MQYTYPRWMKLKEASHYSKIGQKRLIKLAQAGHIKGFQDPDTKKGTWIFCRISIDEYRENQASALYRKALDVLQGDLL